MSHHEIVSWIGLLRAEFLFRGCRTLKDRRGYLRSLRDRLVNMGMATAQVGPPDLVQQAWISAVCVSGSEKGVRTILEKASSLLSGSPEWELSDMVLDIFTTDGLDAKEDR